MKKVSYLVFCSKCGHPKYITPHVIKMYGSFVCDNSISKYQSRWVQGVYQCTEKNMVPEHLIGIADELEVTLNKLNTPKTRG